MLLGRSIEMELSVESWPRTLTGEVIAYNDQHPQQWPGVLLFFSLSPMAGRQLGYWQRLRQWLFGTADRALAEAYKAARKIQAIEATQFGGGKIYSRTENDPWVAQLHKYLNIARLRLTEFQTSRPIQPRSTTFDSGDLAAEALILSQLQLIDEVLERYRDEVVTQPSLPPAPLPDTSPSIFTTFSNLGTRKNSKLMDPSIINTVKRIRQELNPGAEQELVNSFQSSRNLTLESLRFLLLLALVPLIVHFLTKFIVVGPIVDFYYPLLRPENIFINSSLERNALEELGQFERHLKFQALSGITPQVTEADIQNQVKEKAQEIRRSFTRHSANAVKNWLADFVAVTVFIITLTRCKTPLANLWMFIDSIISGLSDTAKAFAIILFTDTFVGFHSPHGWEIVLEGLADHWGIPENRGFNSLFIATFPVLLDTIFKYWIFRYLSGQSPSSVATYKTMNE